MTPSVASNTWMSASELGRYWSSEFANLFPQARALTTAEFTPKVNCSEDKAFAQKAVERVVQRFNVLQQSNLPASCVRYTLSFLTKNDWVPKTCSLGDYRYGSEIVHTLSMNYPKWLLVSTIWPKDDKVLKVVPVISRWWGADFTGTDLYFPNPYKFSRFEYEARFVGDVSKLKFSITESEWQHQIVFRESTGGSEDMDQFMAPFSERVRDLEAQLKKAKHDELARKFAWHDKQISHHSEEKNKLKRQAKEPESPQKRQRTG